MAGGISTSWMDSELLELEEEGVPSQNAATSTSYDWLAHLSKTTPTVPPITSAGGNENDLVLIPTMSSGFEELVTSGQDDTSLATETLGWSFETMNLAESKSAQGGNGGAVTKEMMLNPVVVDTVVTETNKDVKVTGSSAAQLFVFENPLGSLNTNKAIVSSDLTSAGEETVNRKAQTLLAKLPPLHFMTADVILTDC